jgi:hypothetical protein
MSDSTPAAELAELARAAAWDSPKAGISTPERTGKSPSSNASKSSKLPSALALIALVESGDVPPETLAALLGDRDALIRAAVVRGGHPGT